MRVRPRSRLTNKNKSVSNERKWRARALVHIQYTLKSYWNAINSQNPLRIRTHEEKEREAIGERNRKLKYRMCTRHTHKNSQWLWMRWRRICAHAHALINKSIDDKIIEIESNECCWNNFRCWCDCCLLLLNYILHCWSSYFFLYILINPCFFGRSFVFHFFSMILFFCVNTFMCRTQNIVCTPFSNFHFPFTFNFIHSHSSRFVFRVWKKFFTTLFEFWIAMWILFWNRNDHRLSRFLLFHIFCVCVLAVYNCGHS